MTPSDLATHYNADDLLAALCAKLSPEGVAAVVRAAVPFMQGEDKRVRERRLAAERSRRSYAKSHAQPSEPHASESAVAATDAPSESHGEASESHGKSDGNLTPHHPSPSVSLPSPLPSTPPPPPSPAYTREVSETLAVVPAGLRSVEFDAEWLAWIRHCREHARERGKPFTTFTARSMLTQLERWGPAKALQSLRVSGERGSASLIDPEEKRFASSNPQPNSTANGNHVQRPSAKSDRAPIPGAWSAG